MFTSIYIKQPKRFPKWWCHFALPPAVFKNFSCAIYSLTFGIVRWVFFCCCSNCSTQFEIHFTVVLICIYLLTTDIEHIFMSFWASAYPFCASQMVLVVNNLPANAGDIRDMGSIPGWGRCPGGGHGNPLQCSSRILWTKERGGLRSRVSDRVGDDRSD